MSLPPLAAPEALAEPLASSPGPGARFGPWALGLVAAFVAVGPGLGPGSWLNVDLVATPVTPVPRGVWAIGPELPRRVPYALPLAWISTVMDSTWLLKALVVVAITAAVAGAWRLAARWYPGLPLPAAAGAGLLFGLSPFLLTRLGVGHLPLVFAMGLLPWALPSLLDPCARDRRTFLWCTAIGLTGVLGGVLALLLVPVMVLLTDASRRRIAKPLALLVLSQVPWLVPGTLVLVQGASPAAANDFATDGHGDGGALRVLAGHGFWRTPSQVGIDQGWLVPVLALLVAGLAAVGVQRLAPAVRRPAIGAALVGLVIPLASAVPLVRTAYSFLVDSPVGATLREGQRMLPLYLVVLAPAAAGGAADLARRWPGWREGILLVGPGAIALLLAAPGLWGVNGSLDPVRIPASWKTARHTIHAGGGGTVLSLPFVQYVNASVADGRSVVDPMPVFLGGDVLSSSNPLLSVPSQERADPREAGVTRLTAALRADEPVAADLSAVGIHWVVVRHDYDWATYRSLSSDPGFRKVVSGPELDLYEVAGWVGTARDARGRAVAVHATVAPLEWVADDGPVTWLRPGLDGWMRGTRSASTTPGGLVALPAGSGPVWFWPSVVSGLGDFTVVMALLVIFWRRVRLGWR